MNASTRLVLFVAGGCAALGFALKIAELGGSTGPAGQATDDKPAVSRHAARGEDSFAALEPGSQGGPGAGASEPDGPAATADGGSPGHAASHRDSPTPYELLDAKRSHSLSPRAAARLARREAREARKHGGSLAVGETGAASAAGGLASAAGGQQAGGAPAAAGAAPAAAPTLPAEPPASAFPFTTPDDARYALNQQVAVDDVGKIAPQSGTLSFWLQPGWQEGNQDDANFLELGDGRLQVIKNVDFLRFEFTDGSGQQGGIGAPITDWKEGDWHQITTTWSGNTYSLYVDGQLVSQTTYPGGPMQLPPDAKLLIGSAYPENRPVAPGVINGVDVSGRPLGPSEVAGLYAKSTGPGTRRN